MPASPRNRYRILPKLSRALWAVQLANLINAFGNGVVLPFLLIYLHNVRGISLASAGLALAASGISTMILAPVVGVALDHFGARALLAGSTTVTAVGFAGYATVHSSLQALVVSVLVGVGNSGFNASNSSLIASLTAPHERNTAFSLQRIAFNLGIGLGAAAGGLIATSSSPKSYVALFIIDALTFVTYLAVVLLIPGRVPPVRGEARAVGGYRTVITNRLFLKFIVLQILVMSVQIAWLQDILPVFARDDLGLKEAAIGLAFLANTVTIVVVQLPVSRFIEGRRRMAANAVTGALVAGAWLVVLLAGVLHSRGAVAITAVAVAAALVGVGECFQGGTQTAFVAELAEPALLGRYFAVLTGQFQVGYAAGRAVGGVLLAMSGTGMWAVAALLAAGCAGYALVLDREVPEEIRRERRQAPVPAARSDQPALDAA